MSIPTDHQTWDHVYLLGWEDHKGRQHLSTWDGDLPWVNVVVYGVNGLTMPLWSAPVPPGASFEVVSDEDGREIARKKGGLFAFGWYLEKGVTRKPRP